MKMAGTSFSVRLIAGGIVMQSTEFLSRVSNYGFSKIEPKRNLPSVRIMYKHPMIVIYDRLVSPHFWIPQAFFNW